MKYALPRLLCCGLFTSVGAQADVLTIPVEQPAASQALSLPPQAASTDAVIRRYGEPVTRHAAIGDPPISRWDYAGFSVYFERDKVVHSVRQHLRQSN